MNLKRREFLFGSAASCCLAGCRTAGWFNTPKLKFGVASDIHVTTPESAARFEAALRYFRTRGVDAVMMPGDLSDWGLRSGYRYIRETWGRVFGGSGVVPLFITGNHDTDGWKYSDMAEDMRINGYSEEDAIVKFGEDKSWGEAFGEKFAPIRVRTVKGYDFISGEWHGYSLFPKWMQENGARFKCSKPFFYFQHLPAKGTTSDSVSDNDGGAAFNALKDYPNAIVFTGHTHRPFGDERLIWQGEFTAVSCPSLSYSGMPHTYENHGKSQDMPQRSDRLDLRGGEGYVVSVYDDRMVLERLDLSENGAECGPAWIVPLADGDKPFREETRAAVLPAPEFPAGAELDVDTRNAGDILLNCEFPSAFIPTGERVYEYEIRIVPEDGSEPVVKLYLSPYCAHSSAHEPKRQRYWFRQKACPQGKPYHLEVRARNSFGKFSKPLVSKVWPTKVK